MLDELKKLIKEVMPDVNTDEVTADSQLVEDLHFDSLAVMMLAMNIEDAYKITFDGPMNFKTVGDVVAYVENAKK
ncbi:MAG: acyl carrier protein [Bacilli bacterium]|nr:acyl carrier protein [Bacilli bacterium]